MLFSLMPNQYIKMGALVSLPFMNLRKATDKDDEPKESLRTSVPQGCC